MIRKYWLSAQIQNHSTVNIFTYKFLRINTQFSEENPPLLRMISYFLVAIFFSSPTLYFTGACFCTTDNPDHIDFAQYWYNELPVPKLLVGLENNRIFKIHSIYIFIISIFSYGLSIFLARKTLTGMKQKVTQMSPKTKRLHDQLAKYFIYFLLIKDLLELYSFSSSCLCVGRFQLQPIKNFRYHLSSFMLFHCDTVSRN